MKKNIPLGDGAVSKRQGPMMAGLGVLGKEDLRDGCQAGRSSPAHQYHGERGRGYSESVVLLLISAKAPPSKSMLLPPGVFFSPYEA